MDGAGPGDALLAAASGRDPANKGDAETLREYWTHEAHGGPTDFAYADEIAWGTAGDFVRAVTLLKEHAHMTDEQAKGYATCMRQHARMEGKANEARRFGLRPRWGEARGDVQALAYERSSWIARGSCSGGSASSDGRS